jgi:hypothetical protein
MKSRALRRCALILVSLVLGCARLPWSWPLAPAPQLDPAPLAADVAWLADDAREGRGLGTAGLRAAADYVARAFADAGLEPATPGGDFLQRFEMPVAIAVTDAQLGIEGVPLERGPDYEAFAGSADAELEAELVFAGYGISDSEAGYDDYTDIDVDGKIVLVLDHGPAIEALEEGPQGATRLGRAYKLVNAGRHGAAALLLVPSQSQADALAGRAGAEQTNPTTAAGKVAGLGLSRPAADRILNAHGLDLAELQDRIERDGAPASQPIDARVRLRVRVERERDEVANVVGVLRGTHPDEAVVLGAHFDHLGLGTLNSLAPDRSGEVHNGADDNASGTAALIALARSFGQGPRLRRSLVFVAFTAEEVGLVGSAHYADDPMIPLGDTVAMFNMDMVGRLRDDRVTVFGIETSPIWDGLLQRAAEPLSLELELVGDGIGPSDHTSFAVRGVPSLLFYTGGHSGYHTPDDDAERVNTEGIVRVASLVHRVAAGVAAARVRPPARTVTASKSTSRGRGYGPYLGTIPDFAGAPVPGVRLQGVRKDSPAERAGLQAGDVVVSLAGSEVANLEEYAAMLSRTRPGSEIEIVVLRDDRRVATRATLGQRR